MTKLQDERLRFAWKQINPIIEEKTFDLGNMKRFSGLHAGKNLWIYFVKAQELEQNLLNMCYLANFFCSKL
jgi:hypothetical protein